MHVNLNCRPSVRIPQRREGRESRQGGRRLEDGKVLDGREMEGRVERDNGREGVEGPGGKGLKRGKVLDW